MPISRFIRPELFLGACPACYSPAIIRGQYVRVQHRHIIYIQGYDPRGLAQYYRMFRTELRKFGRLYQLSATVSRPKVAADGEIASWTIETKADDWQTRTDYDFLRFEDFIQQRPRPADLAHRLQRGVDLLAAGLRRHHRPLRQGELAVCDLHHLSAFGAVAGSALRRGDRLCLRERPERARHSRRFQHRGCHRHLRGAARRRAEIHRKRHLRALSLVRHDLDLAVLAPRAPRMGRSASTALHSI